MATTNLYNLINLFKTSEAFEEEFIPLTKIEIPIIQRDYAQGRNEYEINRIRNRFLDALYNALTVAKQLKLDFVYGDINDKRVLTPLDGQQRLTTLFLLHWYIGRHEGIDNNELEFLKKFSYSTRYSARTFCEHLVEHVPNFSLDSISEDIIDQSWMPLDWKNDPTINAMLNMLDSIHQKFKDTSGLWHLLEEGCISFYFLSIKDMGLSDELYIKMNSRGKPLTQFEHFKAEWERYIKMIDSDSDKRISRKIDIDWTDILWPYKDANNTIDDKFVRYYKYLCSIIYYKKYPNEEIPQDIFDLTKELFFEKRDDVSDNILFIEEGFDCLKLKDIKPKDCFEKFLTKKQHTIGQSHIDEEIDVFEDCCKNFGEYKSSGARSFSIGRMLLLYSFILYWKNKDKIDEDQFARRLRIVNNLIKASEDELRAERMNNLLEQTEEIIVKGEIKIEDNRNTFNSMQLQEEIEKNEWLLTHPEVEPQLYYLEDHPLLYGSISVVGIENLGYADRFYSLFNCDKGRVNQALLTIGDYSLKTRDRYQIGTKGFDATWKSIFHKNRDNVKNVNNILVELLGKYETFTDDILDQIINSYIESAREYDWRYYLVKYKSMRPEKYGMYYWHNDSDKKSYDILMMYTEKSIGGRNSNIFLKTLFNKFKSEYPDKTVRLGDYAYQEDGNVIELQCVGKKAYYKDAEFIIEDDENTDDKQTISIKQNQGVDIQDRVEIAWAAIQQLIK